jgi:zinc/manganese transport system substrate-binding protein
MSHVVTQLASALAQVDGENRAQYAVSESDVTAELDSLASSASEARDLVADAGVIVTEPVPLYLLEAMGFDDLTPPAFSEAVEEDSDIPPALLQSVLNLLGDGSAELVVFNAQTSGPQTDAVIDVATDNHVPAVGVTEILPEGMHYVAWQRAIQESFLSAVTDD